MAEYKTRSTDNVWLIGFASEQITGSRLPSGRDVMRNFVFYHNSHKMTIRESASKVYDQVIPFWEKARLPVRKKQHVVDKIEELYKKYKNLVKARTRSNDKDKKNQILYSENLDMLFDISHANSDKLITIEEDKQFLKLQQETRSGSLGPVDKKLADKEKRSYERYMKAKIRSEVQHSKSLLAASSAADTLSYSCSSAEEEITEDPNYVDTDDMPRVRKKPRQIVTAKVSATLDRTNTSVRKSAMIMATVLNQMGSDKALVPSKSTVHRHRQECRKETAEAIKRDYVPAKSVVHWDGKLLPNVSGNEALVDRLPVLLSSLTDGTIKLLGIPALSSGTGRAAAEAVYEQLKSWSCDSVVVGMCFDTTACNRGKHTGACKLLEDSIGRNLLWLPCRHHILEVLLSDCFTVCFGPSTGPEILMFKRFREKWSELSHTQPQPRRVPILSAPDDIKTFILQQMTQQHARDDYLELLCLSGLLVGLDVTSAIRRPGAIHRARWMAKAIYALKMELLLEGNENIIQLTARELQGLRRFNRFVVLVYIKSWFRSRSAVDAPVNDIQLIRSLEALQDDGLKAAGLKMMKRHSWYLSPELASLALFSSLVTCEEKELMVKTIMPERGSHLITKLPNAVSDLKISNSLFKVLGLNDSFLSVPVSMWQDTQSFTSACETVVMLTCVNDSAERGVALIHDFNASTKDETQKQYMLQVVEQHRHNFQQCNLRELHSM